MSDRTGAVFVRFLHLYLCLYMYLYVWLQQRRAMNQLDGRLPVAVRIREVVQSEHLIRSDTLSADQIFSDIYFPLRYNEIFFRTCVAPQTTVVLVPLQGAVKYCRTSDTYGPVTI